MCSSDLDADGLGEMLVEAGSQCLLLVGILTVARDGNQVGAARQIKPADAYALACRTQNLSESEQFPQALRLSPAHGYLGLLLVVHAELVRAFEPGHHFADVVDVHQKRPMRAPEDRKSVV